MRTWLHRYARATIAVFALALILSALPGTARAAGVSILVAGNRTGVCAGRPAPALVQGEAFDVVLSDFPIPVGSGVEITLTMPDESIRGPADMAVMSVPRGAAFYAAPTTPLYLPGPLINSSVPLQTIASWPTGCYTVNVRQTPSPATFLSASAQFQLLPRPLAPQPGNLRLSVQATGTTQANGTQPLVNGLPLTVNIFGQGVPGTATFALGFVQPDGAMIEVSPLAFAPDGTFNYTYNFTSLHQPGIYTFFATTTTPTTPGNDPIVSTARAQFNLAVPMVLPTGNASLEMLNRANLLVPRGALVSIVGRRFNAPATLEVVTPVGVRLPGGFAVAGPDGNFTIGPAAFGQGYPIGSYTLVAQQAGPAPRTATLSWRLIP